MARAVPGVYSQAACVKGISIMTALAPALKTGRFLKESHTWWTWAVRSAGVLQVEVI